MAVDPVSAANIANGIMKVCSVMDSKSDDRTLRNVAIVIAAVILAVMLIIAMLIDAILSPLEATGFIADLREKYKDELTTRFADSDAVCPVGGLSDEEIKRYVDAMPPGVADRQKVIETALSLVGRVGYFWGGKSSAGWNDEWGKPKLVTASGSKTSGTYQPFGLDCSGFTDWVYRTAGMGNVLTGLQWYDSYEISESELKPGDLVFLYPPGTGQVNHVGIYYGKDEKGKKLYIHCASGDGVVLNGYKGFKYWRRAFVDWGE